MGNLTVRASSKTDSCYGIIAIGNTVSKNTKCNRKLMFNIYSWIQRLISPDTSLITKEIPVNFYSATKFSLIQYIFPLNVTVATFEIIAIRHAGMTSLESPPPPPQKKNQVLSFWCKLYLWKWWPEKKRFPW